MAFGNTLFTRELINNQEHANWNWDGNESLYGAMNQSNNQYGLKYVTKTSQNIQGRDGNQGNNTVNSGTITTGQGVFRGQSQQFPIHDGIQDTTTNNNAGADFIPEYATIKFIIYHGVH